jgi:hypothetical protein
VKRLLIALALVACTDDINTIRTLEAHGFTNVTVTGWSAFECSDRDTFSTGFEATNVQGQRVNGTVCCGLMTKGCTVRF